MLVVNGGAGDETHLFVKDVFLKKLRIQVSQYTSMYI